MDGMTHRPRSARSPRVARHLSFWLPGLGQIYRRDWCSGVVAFGLSGWLWDRAAGSYPARAMLACEPPAFAGRFVLYALAWLVVWWWSVRDAGSER